MGERARGREGEGNVEEGGDRVWKAQETKVMHTT